MRVRALKTTHGSYGTLPRGCVDEVPDHEARELVALGYVIEELPLAKQEAVPANDNIPLSRGGQTGADVPQSLSPVDQVQQQQELSEPAESPAFASLPSTTDTNSPHGQMSSTPATTTGGKRSRVRPRSRG